MLERLAGGVPVRELDDRVHDLQLHALVRVDDLGSDATGRVTRVRAAPDGLLVALCVLVVGCGGTTGESSVSYVIPPPGDVVVEQRSAFEDGVVSKAEYVDAYGRFERCAGSAVKRVSVDPTTAVVVYETSEPLASPGQDSGNAVNDCYQKFFADTEVAYQLTDPVVQAELARAQLAAFDALARPCLEALDVSVPDSIAYATDSWNELNQLADDAMAEGTCTTP